MKFVRQCLLIARKDVTTEIRTKVIFSSTIVFSLLVLIVFHFAFDLGRIDPSHVASGILWVAFIFSGTLGISRSFQYEKENGCLDALILSPVGPGAVFLGKLAGNLLFMLILESLLILVFLVLFNVTVSGSLFLHGSVIFLATLGFVTVGTLLSAVSVNLRAREIMLPVLLFPVVIPVLMAAVKSSGLLMMGGAFAAIESWLGILVAFDAIFLVSSFWVFEYVIQE